MNTSSIWLDDKDIEILRLLQSNGRLTHAAIGKAVGLTGPSVYARVQRLEQAGVIRGYVAALDPAKIGQGFVAFIRVSTSAVPARKGDDAFEKFVHREPCILECYSVDGEDIYLLKVRTDSPRGLQDLLNRLRAIKNVSRTVTTIALEVVKEAGPTGPIDGKALRTSVRLAGKSGG
ncbi:MAG: Lrp/AsnC family transcriptional regulator [Anaerolineae bacterium]|nr:Lrp/AsnC family transcriptional regulator [Anaerolineae bacterium]